MKASTSFWSDMPSNIRLRMGLGALFLAGVGFLFFVNPLIGITVLMLPILWTVVVNWVGSESGLNFGPHSRTRKTAFGYFVRHIWQASRAVKLGFVVGITCVVLGGLGWISTKGLRASEAEPSLTSYAVDVAGHAADATKETAGNWYATTKGWFAFGRGSD